MVNKTLLYTLAASLLSLAAQLASAKAEAILDRSQINMNETVGLTIQIDETSIFGSPDIDVLKKNFEILGSNKSSQSSWINGKSSATTQWVYQLAPRHEGVFTIPAIEVNGEKTTPLTLTVKANGTNNGAANGDPVFIEADVDKSSSYVQQQIVLTLRINSSIPLQDLQLEEMQLPNVLQQEIGNSNYRRNINGTTYVVHELKYALFPQTSGELTIPAINALAIVPQSIGRNDVFGRMFNQGKQLRLRSNPITLDIKAIPASQTGKSWLPAEQLKITESWSQDPENIQLGDSITRTITTTAIGLTAEQLPDITIAANDSIKVYPDQPKLANSKNDNGIIGTRTETLALVATKPGTMTLPEVRIHWWDTNSNSEKTATLPELTLTVKGELPASAAPQPPTPAAAPATAAATPALPAPTAPVATVGNGSLRLWQLSTAAALSGMLLFAGLWWRARQVSGAKPASTAAYSPGSNRQQHLKHLQSACQNNNPAGIRSALLAWGRLYWPDQPISSVMDIARLLGSDTINRYAQQLDAALYTGSQPQQSWQGLYDAIAEKDKMENQGNSALAPLYPTR